MQVFVLDTGAFLTDWTQRNPDKLFFTTPSIISEIRNKPSRTRVETLLSLGRLTKQEPKPSMISSVREAASKSGDVRELSENDVELLALAQDIVTGGNEVTVVSTDLALLNTAAYLAINTLDPKGRMQYQIKWMFECPACGHKQNAVRPTAECPVCGTSMRRKPKRRKRVS